MRRLVLKFKSGKEHYKSDGCVFFCFDRRFKGLRNVSIEFLKLRNEDLVQVAGGAMELRSPDSEASKYLLEQAIKSWRLHGTRDFYPIIHADCGAYGAAGLLPKDIDEHDFLEQELLGIKNRLGEDLKKEGCEPRINLYLADFDGLWEVE